jgi:hypothetical protein
MSPYKRFVPTDILSHGCYVSGGFIPMDALSLGMFCPCMLCIRTFSLGNYHYASFQTRSLGIYSCFPTLPSASWATSYEVHLPSWPSWEPSWEPSDLSGLEPDGPPWVSFVFSAFGHLFQGPTSCLTVPRTILSEWTRLEQFPLVCSWISLECLFRMVDVYYLFCVSLYTLHFN